MPNKNAPTKKPDKYAALDPVFPTKKLQEDANMSLSSDLPYEDFDDADKSDLGRNDDEAEVSPQTEDDTPIGDIVNDVTDELANAIVQAFNALKNGEIPPDGDDAPPIAPQAPPNGDDADSTTVSQDSAPDEADGDDNGPPFGDDADSDGEGDSAPASTDTQAVQKEMDSLDQQIAQLTARKSQLAAQVQEDDNGNPDDDDRRDSAYTADFNEIDGEDTGVEVAEDGDMGGDDDGEDHSMFKPFEGGEPYNEGEPEYGTNNQNQFDDEQ